MNNASLRTYIYKSLILGLVPVLTIINFQSISVADPGKTSKPKTPAKSAPTKARVAATPVKAIKPKTPVPARLAPPQNNNFADSYTLGPSDRLRVDIFNVPEYSGEFFVLGDGAINLPVVGAIPVQGLTIQKASALLTSYFSRYVKRPIVTISVLAPRPVQFAIAGEVTRAGSYTIPFTLENRKFPSISQAIQLAGGTTQTANLRQVQVRRAATGRIIKIGRASCRERVLMPV